MIKSPDALVPVVLVTSEVGYNLLITEERLCSPNFPLFDTFLYFPKNSSRLPNSFACVTLPDV